jgi:hypothetical protein
VKIRALHDGNNALVTDPLTGNDVSIWRQQIALARKVVLTESR